MTDSPFLPGTQIQFAWDSTSLGWLKECPRKYQYHMILGLRSKSESVHLRYGQLYHSALEHYDKARALNLDHEEALLDVVQIAMNATWDNGAPWEPDHPSKTRETLIRSIIWYLDHFKDDPAQTVLLANGKPAVELSFRMELDYSPNYGVRQYPDGYTEEDVSREEAKFNKPYVLCGHLDRVVNYSGGAYVMDRKTSGSTITSNYFDQYDPDNQMSLYTLAAKVIYQTPVKGVIIDAVQVAVGFSRFSRGFTYRTDAQIEEWLADTKHWLRLAEAYATEGYWPMNDKSCHKYGGCAFRKICSKDPSMRQKFLDSDFVTHPWNPLEVR